MLSGKQKDVERLLPYVDGNLKKAFALLKEIDFTQYANGDYPLDGDKIIAKVNTYVTEPESARRWEKHAQYIDIQLLGRGEEKIGYKDYEPSLSVTEDRMAADDVAFYDGITTPNYVTLQQGEFAVLFPWEVHQPNCQCAAEPSTVQKIVIKVKFA